jgi:hypothetical protein
MKKLITDGGGEFCNQTLAKILSSEGVQHNLAPPYTPQQNGFAKRENRTIINMTWCMLSHSKMAPEWWGDAVVASAMTTNCLPSLSKSKTSPVKLFLKFVPSLNFLKPFGCQAWSLKAKAVRDTKFESISWKGTFLGYINDYSAYRILQHDDIQVIHSQNIQFNEEVFPTRLPLSNSLNISSDDTAQFTPVFNGDPVLPFEDLPIVDQETPEQPQEETPVDNYPISPETG